MAKVKNKTAFFCSECGMDQSKWFGVCPACGAAGTATEQKIDTRTSSGRTQSQSMDVCPVTFDEISTDEENRIVTGIGELDVVLGGGIVPGSLTLVGGDPGIGKSTLLLQVCKCLGDKNNEVLYISGEESLSQIKLRAQRIGTMTEHVKVLAETCIENAREAIRRSNAKVVVIDSIQTMFSESLDATPGSVSQVREVTNLLMRLAKEFSVSIFIVGHVTKEGVIAGPKIVEHMVDTVLYFESAESGMRMLRAAKSRFGSVDEIGLFEMTSEGLKCVQDASKLFLGNRSDGDLPSGIAFTPVIEGSRTFVVEVQALVVPAKSGYQRIYSDKIELSRVNRISAILERHAGLDLSGDDIYINVAGGMKIKEGSVDLAVALALYSSKTDIPLSSSLASFGELSLAGEVRPVTFSQRRLRTLTEMGFSKTIVSIGTEKVGGSQSENVKDVRSAVIAAFKGRKKNK